MGDFEEQTQRYNALKAEIIGSGGFVLRSMGQLRDVHGAGKLGAVVVENIAEKLIAVGLSHFPEDLPTTQAESVFVYQIGMPPARLFDALKAMDDESSAVINSFINPGESKDTETVKKIRELVCD